MKIGFITDPLESFKIKKDSTYAMMREGEGRGHELFVMQQEDIVWKRNRVFGVMSQITLRKDADPWYSLGSATETALADLDAIVMRKDPPFDVEYVTSTWLLSQAQREGAKVFNDPRALRDHSEKLAIAQFPQFTAPTLVSRSAQQVHAFIDEHGEVVLKPLDGMGGQSIFRVNKSDPNRNVIVETLSREGGQTIMAQRYIPEIRDGDKRVLVIDGKPVPHCLARIPKAGESRGNLAAGGTGVARPLSPRDLEIATTLGPELARRGLLLVGLDVIGDYLTEVNVTSPTCFQEITDQTGFNVAGMFMDALQAACAVKHSH
ncbi:MAG: glutathione synthase [Burkholderiales bacterium]